MRTALFVYQSTCISISTSESDLELTGMTDAVPLTPGCHELTVTPGVYKIDSSHGIDICGNTEAFDAVSAKKDNDPAAIPPGRALSSFTPQEVAAMGEFLATPDAKQVVNP